MESRSHSIRVATLSDMHASIVLFNLVLYPVELFAQICSYIYFFCCFLFGWVFSFSGFSLRGGGKECLQQLLSSVLYVLQGRNFHVLMSRVSVKMNYVRAIFVQ